MVMRIVIAAAALSTCMTALAQPSWEKLLQEMRWRNIGPGNSSGRIVDIEAVESDFRRVFVASASGGVWKSVNAGTTWTPVFDSAGVPSIGDIALFQKDPDTLWVGTGEANNRNSVSWGKGVFKSTDGGSTWNHAGLENTFQIARIVTHPSDRATAYVAAVGNLWGYSGDRGLFKTTDGGATWVQLGNGLPDDRGSGCTDLVMDPVNPDVLYAAFYHRLRRPWRFDSGGPGGGIFRSRDGGRSWMQLTRGLPAGETGRIGLAVSRSAPNVVMAIVEHGVHPAPSHPDFGNMSVLGSGIYRSEDRGDSWSYLNRYNNRPFYYSQIRINPVDDKRIYVLTTRFMQSTDGGRTLRPGGGWIDGDYHAMWLDPTHADRYYVGNDKGPALTHDHGLTFNHFDNMALGQFCAIGVDMRDPYFVYGGTQDNGSWGGPSFARDVLGILNDKWWKLHWGDGSAAQVDPTDWRTVYTETENGALMRYNPETRQITSIRPTPSNILNLADLSPKTAAFRYNWNTPLLLSHHNPRTLYFGGNHVFRSVDRGEHWSIISPDLTTNDPEKTRTDTGGLTRDVTGAETHCTVTAIAESPLLPGLLWAGTDDGNLWLTRDGGAGWESAAAGNSGLPRTWVSCVEASRSDRGTAYVAFDGHRSDDFSTCLFKTTDYGRSWTSIASGLPSGHTVWVVREDPRTPRILYVGTEFGCFVTVDGGASWWPLMSGLPPVAVRDLVIHPRDNDLVAGTHGRGIWVLDDLGPLQRLSEEVLATEAWLFPPRPATLWVDQSRGGQRGQQFFAGTNPPSIVLPANPIRQQLQNSAVITFYLKEARAKVPVEIVDLQGLRRRRLEVSGQAGINRIRWDLRFDAPARGTSVEGAAERAEEAGGTEGAQRPRSSSRPPIVEPGDYLVRLSLGERTWTETLTVRADPLVR